MLNINELRNLVGMVEGKVNDLLLAVIEVILSGNIAIISVNRGFVRLTLAGLKLGVRNKRIADSNINEKIEVLEKVLAFLDAAYAGESIVDELEIVEEVQEFEVEEMEEVVVAIFEKVVSYMVNKGMKVNANICVMITLIQITVYNSLMSNQVEVEIA